MSAGEQDALNWNLNAMGNVITVKAGKRPTYPAYKPSGVAWLGDVPEHWQPVRLRYRARINPTRSELNGTPGDLDVSFVPMEAVHEYGGLTLDQTRPLAEVATGYTYFLDGDVLAAKITPCFENGKGSIAEGLVNGIGYLNAESSRGHALVERIESSIATLREHRTALISSAVTGKIDVRGEVS